MRYVEIPPNPSLKPFVKCFWKLRTDDREHREFSLFPDGSVELVICCSQPPSYAWSINEKTVMPQLALMGISRKPVSVILPAKTKLVGIRFRPASFSRFTTTPIEMMTDRIVDCHDVFGRSFETALTGIIQPCYVKTIQKLLEIRLQTANKSPMFKLADDIVESRGSESALAIGREAGIGERRIRRWFRKHVGVSPHLFSRILRFRHALRLLRFTSRNISNVANYCGYFDQAHMSNDVKEFSGMSMTTLLSRSRRIVASCSRLPDENI